MDPVPFDILLHAVAEPAPLRNIHRQSDQIFKRPLHPAVTEQIAHDIRVQVHQDVDIAVRPLLSSRDGSEDVGVAQTNSSQILPVSTEKIKNP